MIGLRKIRRYWFAWTRHSIGEVWMLHRVCRNYTPDNFLRNYEISQEGLEKKIVEYRQKGYEFVSMEEAYARMSERHSRKGCFVAITLDDGYEDNYSVAYPIFKKYSVPFCIYVAEGLISEEFRADEKFDYSMMSLAQLDELAKEPLCTLGAHTYSHTRLGGLSYEQQLYEIQRSVEWLSGITHQAVEDFAYPYGSKNKDSEKILRKLGIKRAVLAGGGEVLNATGALALNIPRVLVND